MSAKKDSVSESRYEKPEALRLGAVAQGVGASCASGSTFQQYDECYPLGNDAGTYCYTGVSAVTACSSDGNSAIAACSSDGNTPNPGCVAGMLP